MEVYNMYKLTEPAWCFNYNASNGIANNVSRLTPYSAYLSMNVFTYKNTYPAFIQNAVTGVRGQGILHYGVLASTPYVSNIPQHKNTTHVWSMAIPSSMNAPIGIFTANFNAGVYYAPNYNIVGPSINANFVWYVDTDHYLKFGCTMYNGSNAPPDFSINFGVDMTPYMYAPTVNNTDAYCGHRYAMVYDADNRAYNLFVDNTDTLLAAVTENNVAQITLSIMNTAIYNDWFNINGGAINNYSLIGPGAYMGSTSLLNAYNQGVVYISDWYGWETVLNKEELQSVFEYNWKTAIAPKTTSTLAPFSRCDNLEAITIPPVVNIGKNTVQYCNNLKSIALSEGTNEISSQAFYSCPLVSNVRIPESVQTLYTQAFYNFKNLHDVTISANCPMVDNMITPNFNVRSYKFYQKALRINTPKYKVNCLMNELSSIPEFPSYIVDRTSTPIVLRAATPSDICDGGEVIFDNPVRSATALQYRALSVIVKEETENTITFEGTSIRDTSLSTMYTVNKVDTQGFMFYLRSKHDSLAYNCPAAVDITGHINNSFGSIPMVVENGWVVINIRNIASNDCTIECLTEINNTAFSNNNTFSPLPNYSSVEGMTYGIPYILGSFNGSSNVVIKNAEYIAISNSFCNCPTAVTFENCNYIYINPYSFANSPEPQFINCNVRLTKLAPYVNRAEEYYRT